jgi:hypothetical protein
VRLLTALLGTMDPARTTAIVPMGWATVIIQNTLSGRSLVESDELYNSYGDYAVEVKFELSGSDVDPWNIRFDAINQKWSILNIPTRRVLGSARGYAKTLFSQGRKRLNRVNTESVAYEDRSVLLGGSNDAAWNDGAPTWYRWNIIPVDDGSESSFLIKNSATGRYLGESVFLGVSSSDRVAMARPENRVDASEPNPCTWRFVPVTTNRTWHSPSPVFGVDSNAETTERFADTVCPSAHDGQVDG